jgi:hypothetical protein
MARIREERPAVTEAKVNCLSRAASTKRVAAGITGAIGDANMHTLSELSIKRKLRSSWRDAKREELTT